MTVGFSVFLLLFLAFFLVFSKRDKSGKDFCDKANDKIDHFINNGWF